MYTVITITLIACGKRYRLCLCIIKIMNQKGQSLTQGSIGLVARSNQWWLLCRVVPVAVHRGSPSVRYRRCYCYDMFFIKKTIIYAYINANVGQILIEIRSDLVSCFQNEVEKMKIETVGWEIIYIYAMYNWTSA